MSTSLPLVRRRRRPLWAAAPLALLVACVAASCVSTSDPPPPPPLTPSASTRAPAVESPLSRAPTTRTLTLLHVADMESAILFESAASSAGGVARTASLRRTLTERATAPTLFLAAGDTFLPAPELKIDVDGQNAVLAANHLLGFVATALGNHEFDLGESFLAEMVAKSRFAYLASTLEFAGGPLAALVTPVDDVAPFVERTSGRILARAKACAGGELIDDGAGPRCTGIVVGLVGAAPPSLRQISNLPPHIHVADSLDALRARLQEHVDALTREGVDVVVLLSHLQGVHHELALLDAGLTGVDVIVAGGGDNRLADAGDRLLATHARDGVCEREEGSCYPIVRRASDGAPTLVVAVDGQLLYLGHLTVGFDASGHATHVDEATSRAWPVDEVSLLETRAAPAYDALAHETKVRELLAPLLAPIATSSVFLDGIREHVRNRETNLGDLAADSMLFAAHTAGHQDAWLALRNGGGIRAPIGTVDARTHERRGGTIRRLDVETSFRFDNPLVVVEVSHEELRHTLESALREAGTTRGHFPQVSESVFIEYADAPDQVHVLTDGKTTALACSGARVRTLRITVDDRTHSIVEGGVVVTPDARIKVVTLDYLARGGDGYFPLISTRPAPIVDASGAAMTEQRAFVSYVEALSREGTWDDGKRYAPLSDDGGRRIRGDAPRASSFPPGCETR